MRSPVIESKNNTRIMSIKKFFTLVFLKRENALLLGYKTRGIGKGLWNGFGGKLEENESMKNCAKREMEEECNLIVKDLKPIGIVRYEVEDTNTSNIIHIFTGTEFEGNEQPSVEMNPIKWFKFNEIPYNKMWPCSPLWYPLMIDNKYFTAHVFYSSEHVLRETIIREQPSLEKALQLGN